jgi:hypothetical protein
LVTGFGASRYISRGSPVTFPLFDRVQSKLRRLHARRAIKLLTESHGSVTDSVRLLFDEDWYRVRYPDVTAAGIDPLQHFMDAGVLEGRNPNALFDSDWYLATYDDVAQAGIPAVFHYVAHGAAEMRDPGPEFSTRQYLDANPWLGPFGFNPLAYRILAGSDPTPEWDSKFIQSVLGTDRFAMRYLEMDISYACNLQCRGCGHYSNENLKGWVDFEEGSQWITDWSQRVYPAQFRLLGGEPLTNPRLCDYIRLVHKVWPRARRAVVTNGFLIDRQPELFRALAETNTALDLSLHERSEEYLAKCNLNRIEAAGREYGFDVSTQWATPDEFLAFRRGEGANMMPFTDGDPAASFAALCKAYTCPTLHNGQMYKCAALALLPKVDQKFNLSARKEWTRYLSHTGLGTDATDDELLHYVYVYHNDCDMCPAKLTPLDAAM